MLIQKSLDETTVLFSECTPETEVLKYQENRYKLVRVELKDTRCCSRPSSLPFLSLQGLSYVVAHTRGTTEREKEIGLKVSLNKITSASMTGRVCSG